jgi:SAM-dependent methyltransferase
VTDLDAERSHHDAFYGGEGHARWSTPIFAAARESVWRVLAKVLARHDKPVALSLGSGDGAYELRSATLVSRMVGIELSPVGVQSANAQARAVGLSNVRFLAGDLAEADRLVGDERFDVVWVVATLHHLSPHELARCLAMLHGLLRPNGSFVSYDPNRYRLAALAKPLMRRLYHETHSPDEHEIKPPTIAAALLVAGFADVRLQGVDFVLGPLAWAWPTCPAWLARLIRPIDATLARLPVVWRVASGFAVVATRPEIDEPIEWRVASG